MSRVTSLYHIVLRTKHSEQTINEANERALYTYIYSMCRSRNVFVHRINGMPDHVHIFADLSNKVWIVDLVRDLKRETSVWMKQCGLFPSFRGWIREYCALSKSSKDKEVITQYIISQKVHHQSVGLVEELKSLYREEGMEWNEWDERD